MHYATAQALDAMVSSSRLRRRVCRVVPVVGCFLGGLEKNKVEVKGGYNKGGGKEGDGADGSCTKLPW